MQLYNLSLQNQCLQRKACLGLTFTDKCKDSRSSNLTYSELSNYYNKLVMQLKLAEYNFNTAINVEIKDESKSESLKKQKQIIKLLNESILPALEFTVSQLL